MVSATPRAGIRGFGSPHAFNGSAERKTDFVLTNLIQPAVVGPGSSVKSSLASQPAGQGPSSFASTLQSAGTSPPLAPQPVLATVAVRGKPAERKQAENIKMPASVRAARIDIGSSLRTASLIQQSVNSQLEQIGSVVVVDLATEGASVGFAHEVQADVSTHNSATVLGSQSSAPVLPGGKQTPTGDLSSQPNLAATVAKQINPLTFPKPAPPPVSVDESETGQRPAASSIQNVTSQAPASTLPLNLAVNGAAQKLSPATIEPAHSGTLISGMNTAGGTGGTTASLNQASSDSALQARSNNLRSVAPPLLTGLPLSPTDPARGTGNATAEINQVFPGTTPQAGNDDLQPLTPTSPLLDATNTTTHTGSRNTGINEASPSVKPQGGDSSPVALLPTPTLTAALLDALNLTSAPSHTIIEVVQSASERDPTSSSGPGPMSPASPGPAFSSSSTGSTETSKSVPMLPTLSVRAAETIAAPSASAKETTSTKVLLNQEHTTSKAVDSSSSPTDANVQPTSPSAIPAAPIWPVAGGNPSGPAVTAIVAPQVSLAANQDAGSRNAALPAAAEPQSSAASSPAPLPAAGTVETARLVAGAMQSEMHLGVQTQAFGNVEVHTVVRDSLVGLTVGSERGDLRTLLAPEVSGLQTTFRQQDLHFDNIRFLESGAGTSAGFSGGADSHSRSSSQPQSSSGGTFSNHSPPEDLAELDVGGRLRTGLNVLA